jgi:hypothetical protein
MKKKEKKKGLLVRKKYKSLMALVNETLFLAIPMPMSREQKVGN